MNLRDLFKKKDPEPEPEPEWTPPSDEAARCRFMILWANCGRSFLESQIAGSEDPHESLPELQAWVAGPLAGSATQEELARHAQPAGTWSERDTINDSWDREAAVMLAWALGLLDSPPAWDIAADWVPEADDFFDFPVPKEWRTELSLRDADTIEQMAQSYEATYWRLRAIDGEEDPAYAKKLMGRANQLGQVKLASDGDLALSDGRSLLEADPEELGLMRSIVMERLSALNWLCGQDPDWDEISCDTIVSWLWDEHWS